MNIAILSPEVAPYSKTGGLADVARALPEALSRLGHDVKIFSPFYRCTAKKATSASPAGVNVNISMGGKKFDGEIWRDGKYYFVRNDYFFSRDDLYGEGGKEYEDNALRFAFFSMAVLEALAEEGERVDIIHCHDWQSGLAPLFLKSIFAEKGCFKGTASVFTIHNLAYQGLFPRETMKSLSLPEELFNYKELEFYNKMSFMKGGLVFAHMLTTVSRKYSMEIQGEGLGCGLEGVLRERKDDLFGVVNGIDYGEWDPTVDSHIITNFSNTSLEGKALCKKDLRKEFKLPDLGDIPLIGMVSRLDPQKGFEIIEKAANRLMKLRIQMVFVGKGTPEIETFLKNMAKKFPDKVGLFVGYNEELAHKVEAGADIFLMPSRYEPCGLNHLFSLKYGTIPVVRATGGLDDTIINYNARSGRGNGFKFTPFSPEALLNSVKRAVNLYMTDRDEWVRLQKEVMKEDHPWEEPARTYEKIYRRALEAVRTEG